MDFFEKGVLRLTVPFNLRGPVSGEAIVNAVRKVIPEGSRQEFKVFGTRIMLGEKSNSGMVWDIGGVAAQAFEEMNVRPMELNSLMRLEPYTRYSAVALTNCEWGGLRHDLMVSDPAMVLLRRMMELKVLLEGELNK